MLLFWVLSFAIAWAITLPPALAQLDLIESSPVPPGLGILIGIVPIIAASVVAMREGVLREYWRSLGRLPSPSWTWLIALLLPLALLGLAYLASNLMGEPIRVAIDPALVGFALLWFVLAFGEEAGWRGFALPRLAERYGFWSGSLVLGLAWCIWHYPKLLGSPYLGSLAEAIPLIALFSIQVVISNFILCWLYFRSGNSVWAPTLYHTSFNVIATAYFLAATDLLITAAMALIVLAIFMFDRHPQRNRPAEQ